MLISEFSQRTGLPRETVRYYVKRGLLKPESSRKGGSRPYQIFSEYDVELTRIISIHKSLGSSLTEIGEMIAAYGKEPDNRSRTEDLLTDHIEKLEHRKREIDGMLAFLRAKLAWLDSATGQPPRFPDFV